MPKATGKRKKKSEAWKNLMSVHKKGYKRVRIHSKRRKNGIDPLTQLENVRRVQIILKYEIQTRYVSVVMFREAFDRIGLHVSDEMSMRKDKLNRPASCLKKTFDQFDHNDAVLKRSKELKLVGPVGRCFIFTEKFQKHDACITILATEASEERFQRTRDYVSSLFKRYE